MNQRILELANNCFEKYHDAVGIVVFHGDVKMVESFYKAAHQDGQRAMRERAAKECDLMNKQPMPPDATSAISTCAAYVQCSEAIRNLEITNE